MSNVKQLSIESPLSRIVGFATSVLLSNILASAFVTEITVQGQLVWSGFYTKKTFWALIILILIYLSYYTIVALNAKENPHAVQSVTFENSNLGQIAWRGMSSLAGWVMVIMASFFMIYHYHKAHSPQEQLENSDISSRSIKLSRSEFCNMKEVTDFTIDLFSRLEGAEKAPQIENIYCVIAKMPTLNWAIWARSIPQGRLILLVDGETRAVKAKTFTAYAPGEIIFAHRFSAIDFDGNGIDELVAEEHYLHHGYSLGSVDVLDGALNLLARFTVESSDLGEIPKEQGGYEYRADSRFIGMNDKTIIEILPKRIDNVAASFFKTKDHSVVVRKRMRFAMHDGKFSTVPD